MSHTFTSVAYAVERLLEAEHFLERLLHARGTEFGFELNAFLSASRSVTFVLQSSLAHVPGFEAWYSEQQKRMKADLAMRFFLELRNISQKQGPVSYVGGSTLGDRWSYKFVSDKVRLPRELFGRDIVDCCGEQLQKLSRLVLGYYREFPFHACVTRAWTREGINELGFTLTDVELCLGYPENYLNAGRPEQFSLEDIFHVLRRDIDPVDVGALERLANGEFLQDGKPLQLPSGVTDGLSTHMVRILEEGNANTTNSRTLFIRAAMERIQEIEEDGAKQS